jgi:hypothetical protein
MANPEDNVDVFVTGGIYVFFFETPALLPGFAQPVPSLQAQMVGEQLPWISVAYTVAPTNARFVIALNTVHLRAVMRQK